MTHPAGDSKLPGAKRPSWRWWAAYARLKGARLLGRTDRLALSRTLALVAFGAAVSAVTTWMLSR